MYCSSLDEDDRSPVKVAFKMVRREARSKDHRMSPRNRLAIVQGNSEATDGLHYKYFVR